MFGTNDTIVAIATPPGTGGIGVVRIGGPSSQAVARTILDRDAPLRPRYATLAHVRDVDAVIATLFVAPHSYTGEDIVEISAHGSPVVLRAILEAAVRAGARLAQPGEFTLRAFLNGRIDLPQAEAVADLIEAATPLQARTAFDQLEGTLTRRIGEMDAALFDLMARLEASLDFPDEGYHFIEPEAVDGALRDVCERLRRLLADAGRGRTIREGAHVVILGRPNVGKSSVFNSLAGHARAIVAAIPGTTRDLLTERVGLDGLAVTLVDTAGIRPTTDLVEGEGVHRAKEAAAVASVAVVVLDQSESLLDDDYEVLRTTEGRPRILLRNKNDLRARWAPDALPEPSLAVSAVRGDGIDALGRAIADVLVSREELRDPPAVSNVRHIGLLRTALTHVTRAAEAAALGQSVSEEFILSDLQHARACLEEITGRRAPDELLKHIFERFCIGK